MLQIDFYESGAGETIVLTFPGGGLGIVDAHPSPFATRPAILDLVRGKTLHFVCLTHPHKDHGADLISILEQHQSVREFWHTVSDVDVCVFLCQQYPNYPSPCREAVTRLKKGWAEFLIDIYGAVAERQWSIRQLRSELRPLIVDGVEIHVLSPDEKITQRFVEAYGKRLRDFKAALPDPNLLSAILAVKYGDVVILFGADAVKENWRSATRLFFEFKLPKAMILKVPHHGAANALQIRPRRHEHNYLEICSYEPKAKSVLFSGDSKHPDFGVFQQLIRRTEITCVSNGLKDGGSKINPLNIAVPGARAATLPPVCNPLVSFSITANGEVLQTAGVCNPDCQALKRALC